MAERPAEHDDPDQPVQDDLGRRVLGGRQPRIDDRAAIEPRLGERAFDRLSLADVRPAEQLAAGDQQAGGDPCDRSPSARTGRCAPPDHVDSTCDDLPAFHMDDRVERSPAAATEGGGEDRWVRRIAEREDVLAPAVVGVAEAAPRERLIVDGRRAAADAEGPRGEHHLGGGTAEIPGHRQRLPGRPRVGRDERDRHGRASDVAGPRPEGSQLGEVRPIADDDEVPALAVLRGAGSAPSVEDRAEMIPIERPVRERPDDATAGDRLKDLHRDGASGGGFGRARSVGFGQARRIGWLGL